MAICVLLKDIILSSVSPVAIPAHFLPPAGGLGPCEKMSYNRSPFLLRFFVYLSLLLWFSLKLHVSGRESVLPQHGEKLSMSSLTQCRQQRRQKNRSRCNIPRWHELSKGNEEENQSREKRSRCRKNKIESNIKSRDEYVRRQRTSSRRTEKIVPSDRTVKVDRSDGSRNIKATTIENETKILQEQYDTILSKVELVLGSSILTQIRKSLAPLLSATMVFDQLEDDCTLLANIIIYASQSPMSFGLPKHLGDKVVLSDATQILQALLRYKKRRKRKGIPLMNILYHEANLYLLLFFLHLTQNFHNRE